MPDFASSLDAHPSSHPSPVVAIGTSAGGMRALQALLSNLPGAFPWPILLVQHLHPEQKTHLAEILQRSTKLTVQMAQAGDRLAPDHLYIAPPSHHLTLAADRTLSLNDDPAVHFSRPSIDILFKSLAAVCGEQAIAILLTGSNTDGADGIQAVKAQGGLTIAQSPASAEARRMPQAAIDTGAVDQILDLAAIADYLVQLAQKV